MRRRLDRWLYRYEPLNTRAFHNGAELSGPIEITMSINKPYTITPALEGEIRLVGYATRTLRGRWFPRTVERWSATMWFPDTTVKLLGRIYAGDYR